MERQPQNPEFRINPENFHPCDPRNLLDKKSSSTAGNAGDGATAGLTEPKFNQGITTALSFSFTK